MGRWHILAIAMLLNVGSTFEAERSRSYTSQPTLRKGDFSKYIVSFAKYYEKYTGKTFNYSGQIYFDGTMNLKFSLAGRCGSFQNIYINEYYWNLGNEAYREVLIFHELGHCFLKREHTLGEYKGYPVSMMHQYSLAEWIYLELKEAYIHELFTQDVEFVKKTIENKQNQLKIWLPYNHTNNFRP